ncbi:MAG: hypothetical protein ACOYD3_03600 [Kiritimatiellia bacterium]
MKQLLVSILLTLAIGAASAGVITNIPSAGLAAAVAAAQDGDLLLLDAAEYTFDETLTVDKPITIRGAGIGLTILRGSSATTRHVSVNHAGAMIEGVTFQGKSVSCRNATGFGVQIGANGGTVRVSRVTGFLAGSYWQTGAVELNSDNAVLEDCVVDGNNASFSNDSMCWCGGVYLQKGVVRGCRILANKAHQASGLYIKGGTATGCLIAGNEIYYPNQGTADLGTGAGVYASGGLVTNCLITANRGTLYSGVGGVYLNGTTAKLADCIIRGNVTPAIAAKVHPDLDYSNAAVESNVSRCRLPTAFGADCVTNAVLFQDYAGGDYTVIDAIGADKYETLLGGAFAFSSVAPGAAWTVTDATNATVATGTGADFTFTPATAGCFSVTLASGGDSVTATNAVKAGPVAVTVTNYATLAAAVAAAVDGTAITLADGDYIVEQPIIVTKAITLQGAGWDRCSLTLKAGVNDRVLFLNHKASSVTGLTIANGRLNIYGGRAAATVDPANGAAVRIGARGGRMTQCRITGTDTKNHYQSGSIAILSDDGYVGQCLIDNNDMLFLTSSGWGYGGGIFVAAGLAENCLITNNLAMNGGGVLIGGTGKLRNCTVAGNEAYKTGGGIFWLDGSAARVVNCVFAANRSGASFDTSIGRPEWAPRSLNATQYSNMTNGFSHCAFAGSEAVGTGSFQAVTPFINYAGGDLHGSGELVDKGTTDEGMADEDFEGNDRIQGTAPDVGCYEADTSSVWVSFSADKTVLFLGETVTLTPEIVNGAPGVTYTFAWMLTDRFSNTIAVTNANPELELPCGWYTVALSAWDPALPDTIHNAVPVTDFLRVAPQHLFVVAGTNAASAYPYDSWEKAATNLADAVAEAIAGATITLGEGEHRPMAETIIDRDVTITGLGCGRSVIALHTNAPNSRVLTINSPGAVVEHVGITGGRLAVYSMSDSGVGVGVWIGLMGGTLRDCRVFGNKSRNYYQHGGGVAVSGAQGLVQRCVIECNTNAYREASVHGGGLYLAAGRAENCLIRGNLSYVGGGAAVKQNGILRNCTVVGNRAIIDVEKHQTGGYGGGVYLLGGSIENTVFWDNTSERVGYDGEPEWYGSTRTDFLRCALPAGVATNQYTGGDFIQPSDPRFRDAAGGNFRLLRASPLVNAGTNLTYTAADLDLDRRPRIFNFGGRSGIVDIGCYEAQVLDSTLIMIR